VPAHPPFVIETAGDLTPEALFDTGRDQVVVAVRITPIFGQLDLSVVARVIEEANLRGFTLVREQAFRDEWLICVFDAFDEEEDE
jgi:hypothetical protein